MIDSAVVAGLVPSIHTKDRIVYCGSALTILPYLEAESVQTCITSPPYWRLRDYNVGGQLGQERTPEIYVEALVKVFREVRRVLKKDGTLWLVLGDCYAGSGKGGNPVIFVRSKRMERGSGRWGGGNNPAINCKPKDLIGVPWMVAFALRADGWYLRQDNIWCISGGAWIYARTQKGDMPMMVRDLARLKPGTAQLWNGSKWTDLLGMSRSNRRGDEIEIVLRSGERISCTRTHRFPTDRGLLSAGEMKRGDVIKTCRLPQPERPRDCAIDEDAAWFAGLYLAEGSRSDDCIQLSGHAKEDARWERVQIVAAKFGGSATRTVSGNKGDIRVYGRVLNAIIDELVTGRIAKDKGFSPVVWRYSDSFVASMLTGYLSGDGHWDAPNKRWRLGFARNYNLERDLRVACARLGYPLSLRPSTARYQGGTRPSFRGELPTERSGHRNERDVGEVVEIRKARCREVWDLGVADEPHLFALASGVLTHNSKPNPMPESVTDRTTRSHEYVFHFSKSARYYYDHEAIKETPSPALINQIEEGYNGNALKDYLGASVQDSSATKGRIINGYRKRIDKQRGHGRRHTGFNAKWDALTPAEQALCGRNKRSVWIVVPASYRKAHFATFPPKLIEPCILACSRVGDIVLDPFGGSGTTGQVAIAHGRRALLIELNPEYIPLIAERTTIEQQPSLSL